MQTENFWNFMQINISIYIFQFFVGIALALVIKKIIIKKIKFNYFTFFWNSFIIGYLFSRAYISQFIDLKNDFC